MNATPAVPPPPAGGAAAGAGSPAQGAAATSAAAAIARPANLQALWALLQSPGGEPPDPLDTAARAPIRHLGQLLVSHGLVSPEQVRTALQQQQNTSSPRRQLGQLLVEAGALSAEQLRAEIAAWLGQHIVDPSLLTPDPAALALVPRANAEQLQALPMGLQGDAIAVLLDDPANRQALDQLRFMT